MSDSLPYALMRVKQVADRWKSSGFELLADGTELIGRVPHVAPMAWLHSFYGTARTSDGAGVGAAPSAWRELLQIWNGFDLFSGAIYLYGRRTSYDRLGAGMYQPFDAVVQTNDFRRVTGLPGFFIGGFSEDGSLLYAAPGSDEVSRVVRSPAATVLQTWPSLADCIVTEAERLAPEFDAEGKRRYSVES